MARTLPGIVTEGTATDEADARTAVLAKAYHSIVEDYFAEQRAHTQTIEDAKERTETVRRYGIAGVAAGLLIAVGVIALSLPIAAAALGVLIAAGAGGYAYWQQQTLDETIADAERQRAENEPEGTVQFVSQVGYPLHLAAFDGEHAVFDGQNAAPEHRISVADVDATALETTGNDLTTAINAFEDAAADSGVLDPALADEMTAGGDVPLEQQLGNTVEQLAELIADYDERTVTATVHANDGVTQSLQAAGQDGVFQSDPSIPVVETSQSLAESDRTVDEFEQAAADITQEPTPSELESYRETVNEFVDTQSERLTANGKQARTQNAAVDDMIAGSLYESMSADDYEAYANEVAEEYDLLAEVLDPQAGKTAQAFIDTDLEGISDGDGTPYTDQLRSELDARLPDVNEAIMPALVARDANTRDVTAADDEDAVTVPRESRLFGSVWANLYADVSEQLADQMDDLESDAESYRMQKEQRIADVSQFERMKDAAEQEYLDAKRTHETAQRIEEDI